MTTWTAVDDTADTWAIRNPVGDQCLLLGQGGPLKVFTGGGSFNCIIERGVGTEWTEDAGPSQTTYTEV